MRILVFCPGWGAIGGIERKAERLAAEFRARGHEVVVLARGRAAASTPDAVPPVVRRKLRGVPRRWRPLGRQLRFALAVVPTILGLRRVARAARADVVLTLAVSTFAPYVAGLAGAVPVVLSLEGREAGGVFTATPRALRLALRRAARVVACSRSLAASAVVLAPEVAPCVRIVPNGVDAGRFATATPFAHRRPYVLALGRLTPQKGFDLLIDAFARLGTAAYGVDLLIAGDGPERAALEAAAARLGLGDRVRFLGAVDEARAAALYRGACVVACPSRWEGLPLVCLEAMASGAAVVAAAVDGIPDAVTDGETGVLVGAEDPAALASALAALLADDERRRRLGERARAVARERFAWADVAGAYLDVLGEAARGGNCPPGLRPV
ncbi:MAG TPA: glycosyltransferase [Candidatus Binatia bacterium]|nr:glycosyltransferase [Candidatus Binatia bacterium]